MTKVTDIKSKSGLYELSENLRGEVTSLQSEIDSIKTKLSSITNYDGMNFEGAANTISNNLTNVLTSFENLQTSVSNYVAELNEFDNYEKISEDIEIEEPTLDIPVVNPNPEGETQKEDTSEEKPGDTQTPEEKPGSTQTSEEKPGDTETPEEKPGSTQTSEEKPNDTETPEEKPGDTQTPEEKPNDTETPEEKPGDTQTPEEKPGSTQTPEEKPGDTQTSEEKPGDTQTPEEKPGDTQTPEEKPSSTQTTQQVINPKPSPSTQPSQTPETFNPIQQTANKEIKYGVGSSNIDISKYSNDINLGYTVSTGNLSFELGTEDYNLLCAIVAAESDGTVDNTLSIISTILNRCENSEWKSLYGMDPIAIVTAPNQFDGYISGDFKQYIGNTPSMIHEVVNAALSGVRNHQNC